MLAEWSDFGDWPIHWPISASLLGNERPRGVLGRHCPRLPKLRRLNRERARQRVAVALGGALSVVRDRRRGRVEDVAHLLGELLLRVVQEISASSSDGPMRASLPTSSRALLAAARSATAELVTAASGNTIKTRVP
jgi:hypothetical protein